MHFDSFRSSRFYLLNFPRSFFDSSVHATFSLIGDTPLRRWGSDMSGEGQVRSQWNQALLDDCVAPAFCFWLVQCSTLVSQLYQHSCVQAQLRSSERRALASAASATALVAASASSGPLSAAASAEAPSCIHHSLHSLLATFFAYFPTGAPTSAPFARLMTRVYAILCDQPVIYAPIGSGALLLTEADHRDQTDGISNNQNPDNDGDGDDGDSGLWLIPAHTLRLPAVADRVPGLDSEPALRRMGALLRAAKCPLAAHVPPPVHRLLAEARAGVVNQ